MYYLLYTINALLMLVPPVLLAIYIARRLGARWSLFGIGAATFILSQVLHIPFNWLVLQQFELVPVDNLIVLALFLGLSAGVFEEGGRYLAYRYWAKDARTWGRGLMLGAGHGGIEAIIIGLLFAVNFVALSLMRAGLIPLPDALPPGQMAMLQSQIDEFFSVSYLQTVLGGVERLFSLTAHLAMSLLVMQVFVRGRIWWLLAAIGWHTLLNAVAVYMIETTNIYLTEAAIGVMAMLSLAIIWALYRPEPVEPEPEPLPPVRGATPVAPEQTADKLDESRYN